MRTEKLKQKQAARLERKAQAQAADLEAEGLPPGAVKLAEVTIAPPIIVRLELTPEQAELCKSALMAAKFAGNMAELLQIVDRVMAITKIFDLALADATAVKPSESAESVAAGQDEPQAIVSPQPD